MKKEDIKQFVADLDEQRRVLGELDRAGAGDRQIQVLNNIIYHIESLQTLYDEVIEKEFP